VNEEASHYVKLFGGNKIGNLTFWLPLVVYVSGTGRGNGLKQRVKSRIQHFLHKKFCSWLVNKNLLKESTLC